MSEMKRAELTSVSTAPKQKKVKWKQSTYRFVVTLGESNSAICPEYSFAELVKNDKPVNGNPFDELDDDQEVAAIAQRFEAKYGPKGMYSGKRKRTQEMDDYYDPGEGYDEDDPFIDNTEAHDEVVPAIMTTQHGGFYINQGKLDFRYLDEDSSDAIASAQEVQQKKKKKKRALDSGSEEETGAAIAKKFKAMKRKKQLESRKGSKEKIKKRSSLEDRENIFKKKKRKNLDKLQLQQAVSEFVPQREAFAPSSDRPATNVPAPAICASPLAVTTPTKSSMPSPTNRVADETHGKDVCEPAQELPDAVLHEAVKDDTSSDEGKADNHLAEKNTQLPSQLPAELLELIENIKREAKESKEKKLRFFSDGVNKLLLDIELGSRNLPWGSRTAIYSHLGEHLPCGKYTLQRRAKKLRESQEEGQLKLPIQKLREAVMKVMPDLEDQHERDVQKAKSESEQKDEVADVREEASTESEGEERADNRKRPRGPRRKFQWNCEMKDLLLEIVSTKMKLFSLGKSRYQTAEEFLKAFLDSEIKPIWPQGWMQTRMLFKESRKAHEEMTTKGALQLGKARKPSVINDLPSPQVENSPSHMSKTEDVIEISSNLDSDEEKNNSVAIISSSGPKSAVQKQGPLSASAMPHSTPLTSPVGQMTKQSFKASMTSTPLSHQQALAPTTLAQRVTEGSQGTTVKRVTPIPVLGSVVKGPVPVAKGVGSKPAAQGVSSTTGGTSGGPGSVNQQSSSTNQGNPPQKSAPPQQTVNSQQQKFPQESVKVTNLQQNKAAINTSTIVGNMHNSTWTNVNSIVPANKSINPFVAVQRIPEMATQKLSSVIKSSSSSLQQNQTALPQMQQQEKTLYASAASKPNQAARKSQQSEMPHTSVNSFSDIPQAKKILTTSQNSAPSKGDIPTKTVAYHHEGLQRNSHLPNTHLKSGVIGGTPSISIQNTSSNSVPKFSQQNQHIKPTSSLGSSQAVAHGSSGFTAGGSQDNSSEDINQLSTPGKIIQPADKSSVSPPCLLNISSSPSLSRSNSPSPQQSPVSPEGNAALSLYEQIQSQIWHQEAMEDQALKNLALALNCGGSGVSRLFGNGADAGNQSGSR